MVQLPTFELPKYVVAHGHKAKHVLAGSATPYLSIEDLVALSSDPDTTEKAFGDIRSLKLSDDMQQGSLAVRSAIARLYNSESSASSDDDKTRSGSGSCSGSTSISISPEHVITAIGTTGANFTVFQTLLDVGDHVICMYPTYGQLPGVPRGFIPCEVSRWEMDPQRGWKLDLDELRRLIRPGSTKMLVLNNPSNPTGTHMDADMQRKILDIAREHNLTVLVDEIFRPLFHQGGGGGDGAKVPPSFVEHEYTKVVVTGSLSKAYGLTGVRVGFLVCRDEALLERFINARYYTFMSASAIDEVIATEALSERCRPAILERHLGYARKNLELLEAFMDKNGDMLSWTKPTAGATAFIKISSLKDGEALDDVEFCRAVLEEQGLLLTPGSLCFREQHPGEERERKMVDLQGYVRCHFTLPPEKMVQGLEAWDAFLQKRRAAPS
ncbi:hypothetical protein LTS15_007208 [Exophiala xenobiotica]|nr:hypothetical protein LTS15_007208 [Exophiala xenobiotica]